VKKGGEHYVTVACHGSPGADKSVHHPIYSSNEDTTKIGEVVKQVSGTDIGLARLRPGIAYTNELFSNQLLRKQTVQDIRDNQALFQSEAIYMDNPFTGFFEGMFVVRRFLTK
jgi:methyl coenzyme M reductase gamma subunit